MFEVTIKQHFDAAHYLRGYGGRCENLHGHRYEVAVSLLSPGLNETGLTYDFTELKTHLKDILSRFDHRCLNDLPEFDQANPSAENIAKIIHDHLKTALPQTRIRFVTVWESPDAWATYWPSGDDIH
ncbi:MAG: 6-carboxytetrahydropterin synthase QueD [Chloroflexota bacterium]